MSDIDELRELSRYCGATVTERPDGLFQFYMSPLLQRKLRYPSYDIVFESVDKFPPSILAAMQEILDNDETTG